MARHRRSIGAWGPRFGARVAASVVPYWAGRAVHAWRGQDWQDSQGFLAWMLAFTALTGVGRYLMRNTLIGLSREVEQERRESLCSFLWHAPSPSER
ncbi:MAG: hypothetical protein IPP58_16050, partial [Holophagaceae bacterium]|nr:hypothetical protein [Candidatus Geothrix skivensis]